jgi:regulator of protease activity HflC (stomatin/prohibitin superfamily)
MGAAPARRLVGSPLLEGAQSTAIDSQMSQDEIPDVFPPEGFGNGPRRGQRPGASRPNLPLRAVIAAFGLLTVLVLGAAMAVTGRLGFATIDPEEVGVKVNYLTGGMSVITNPGYQVFLPIVEELYKLDKRLQNFEMRGDDFVGKSVVPKLSVRANDGSNFRFESLEIQYVLIPAQAAQVLEISGPGDGFKDEWIKTFTRSILRDEFGRYSAEEIADPGMLQAAFAASKQRLSDALEPYGLRIFEFPQQRPNFDLEYEHAIEERKVTDQDVERLVAMEDQLMREREERLAGVEREKSIEMEQLKGELDRERLGAERAAIELQRDADAFALERVAEGQAEQAQLLAQAAGKQAMYTKEAEGLEARAEALAERGRVVVREAIVEQLKRIRFHFVPYSRDPAPSRLEVSGDSDATTAATASAAGGN